MYASRARDCHAGYTQTRRVYLSIRNVQPIWDITLIPFDPPTPPHPSPRRQRRKILHNVGVSTGTPDFYRDLFFNAPRNDSLRKHTYIYTCVYIRTNIKNERDGGREKSKGNGGAENGEFGGSSVRKGKEDGGARLRWPPHGENKFRSSSPLALDTHYIFPEWRETGYAYAARGFGSYSVLCARTRTLEPSFIHGKCAADVYTAVRGGVHR